MSSDSKPTLLLIDGHSLAFRAFYALSPDSFRAPDGQHTNAVHGFISMLLTILQVHKPSHLAVAFDLSRNSFRTDEYPEYKGTRGDTPPEFNGQTEVLQECLAAMNIKTLTRENFEADDIIASLADQAAADGFRVLVVSGDRDTFQLISEDVTILYPVKGVLNLVQMDDAAVLEKYGIHARQYPDLAALVGETSDNLPGIPGVGPKTAAKWLQQFKDLEGVLAAAEEIPGKVGENLREHKALAIRNRRLNHLIRDLAFDFEFASLTLDGVNSAEVSRVFKRLAFKTLTEKVLRSKDLGNSLSEAAQEDISQAISETATQARDYALPEPKQFSDDELQDWLAGQRQTIGLAIEFSGESPENSRAIDFGFATETQRVHWVPTSKNALPQFLIEWLSDESKAKAVADSKSVSRKLQSHGLSILGVCYDPLLMAYIIDPVRKGFELDPLASDYLDIQISRGDPNALIQETSIDPSLDAWLVVCLSTELHQRLSDSSQVEVFADIELPSSSVLAEMEHVGVQVDRQALSKLFETVSSEAASIAQDCFAMLGREINLASPKQLQVVLFDELGMAGTKTIKTGFSTNAEALNTLYEQTNHPFLERLLAHREATKIKQMVETLLKSVSADSRIHTTYSQTGTSTGRLSSENPNLQNIPIKSERGREMREAFKVSDGFETLLTADYSQIEMRIMAHLSEDAGLIEAFQTGEDLHRFVGSRIFGVAPNEVTPAMRSKVKAMSYGLVYGLSEYGLAKQLRISNAEAKQLMADYFERFGGVRRYLASVVDQAKQEGYTTTVYGRRRPFDDLNSSVFQIRENARRAALNAPIQGTAADIMKLAMNAVAHRLKKANLKSRLLLQVHDELVIDVASGELETVREIAIDAMSNVAVLSVPLEVHIGIGKNWDAAGH